MGGAVQDTEGGPIDATGPHEGPASTKPDDDSLPASPEAYAFVYAEVQRSLDQQAEVIEGLRTCGSAVLGAASIAASFLGGIALDDKAISWLGILAVVALR